MPDKYIVPQFIDNEDKILGPITVRQFLIMLATVIILFLGFKLIPSTIGFVVFVVVVVAVSGTFGFAKVHGQPFHLFFINALSSLMRPSLRVWDKNLTDDQLRAFIALDHVHAEVEVRPTKERPSGSRLRDLTLVVNTGGVYKPDDDTTF